MSTIPAAIDALLAVFGTALPDVQVIDGDPVVDLEPDYVVVGYSADRGSVDAEASRASLDSLDETETYEVSVLISSERGDEEMKPVRDRCFEIRRAMRTALAEDPTLGGLVLSARIIVVNFDQAQNKRGAVAEAQLIVLIEADVYE